MKRIYTLAAATALAGLASVATAQPPAIGGGQTETETEANAEAQTFADHDLNQDGVISRTEAAGNAELRRDWANADANTDGVVDQAEFAQFEGDAMDDSENAE